MSDLMTIPEVCLSLKISERSFHRNRDGFVADGLREVRVGRQGVRFTRDSFEAMIARAVKTGRPIGEGSKPCSSKSGALR